MPVTRCLTLLVWLALCLAVVRPGVADEPVAATQPVQADQPAVTDRPHYNADWSANIFPGGTLRERTDAGRPAGWDDLSPFDDGKAIVTDHRHPYVRLQSDSPETSVHITASANIPADTAYLTVWARTQVRNYQPAEIKEGEENALTPDQIGCRVTVQPVNAEGKAVGVPTVHRPLTSGDYRGFSMPALTTKLAPSAVSVNITVAIENARGWFEVGDIIIAPSSPDDEPDDDHVEALFFSIGEGDADRINRLLDEHPKLLEIRSGHCDQGTPLIASAWLDQPEITQLLIERGAALEARDRNWQATALGWSGFWAHPDVMKVLLEAKADRTATNIMGGGPLDSVRFAKEMSKGDPQKMQALNRCELLLAAPAPKPLPPKPAATQPATTPASTQPKS